MIRSNSIAARPLIPLLLALAALAAPAQAQVLASDDFSYNGALTSNGWIAHSGAGNKVVMSDGSVATLDQSTGSGEDINLPFAQQTATDTTYAAFDMNVPSGNLVMPDASGLYFFHLKDAAFAFRARTGLLTPNGAGDFALAINADNSNLGAGVSWGADLVFNTTYRVVVSWNAGTGMSELWVDPVTSGSTSVTTTSASVGELIEGVALRQSNDYTGFITVDNVAAGKTFADVLGGGTPPNSGSAYCFGDGTGATCPCSAFGAAGEGCANTSGAGGTLAAVGEAAFSNDTFALDGAGLPTTTLGLVLKGDGQVLIPAGDGILCVAGPASSMRSQVEFTSTGAMSFTHFNGAPFGSVANAGGVATHFQLWYRDAANTCTGSGFNFTNAWTVTYLP